MKQLLAALIFWFFAFVALSGAAPNTASPPPLSRIAGQMMEWLYVR
jgi:hypothetical protein